MEHYHLTICLIHHCYKTEDQFIQMCNYLIENVNSKNCKTTIISYLYN